MYRKCLVCGALLLILCIESAVQAGYVTEVVADNPIGYWRLGESAGAGLAQDETVNNRDLTFSNFTAGSFSQPGALLGDTNTAVAFNGSSTTLARGNATDFALPSGQSFSIEYWLKAGSSGNGGAVSKGYGFLTDQRPWYLSRYQDSKVDLYLRSSGGVSKFAQSTTTLNNNYWHHVVGVYDSADAAVRLYVDGLLEATATGVPADAYGTNPDRLVLGLHNANYYGGQLDEVAIYNVALDNIDGAGGIDANNRVVAHWFAGAGAAPRGVAAFDVNYSGNPAVTHPGFAGLNDGNDTSGDATPFSATQNGVTLTVASLHQQDRDRGSAAGSLPRDPHRALLRDFTFATDAQNLTLGLSGLKPDTDYVIRMYGHDAGGNNNYGSIWFKGPLAVGLPTTNPNFLAGNINLTAAPEAAGFNLRLRSSPAGEIQITGRGANFTGAAGSLAFFNGLEVIETPPAYDVIKVDVNNINAAGGPTNRTQTGFLPLALSAPGATSGSVTANGVTVTVTTDRTDTPSRDRNNTGEALVADFIFGSTLDILIDGLEKGKEYEVTIWSQDTNGNQDYSSLWYQDGSLVPFRAGHLNANNPANLGAAAFTAFLTANSTSMLLHAAAANPARNLVFINGLQVRTIPEPGAAVLLGLGGLLAGAWRVRQRRFARGQ